MRQPEQRECDSVARLMAEALAGQVSRRAVLHRAGALGLSAPLVGAVLAAQGRVPRVEIRSVAPAAPASLGEPIKIGAAASRTGSNGRMGLYQIEAYQLREAQ